MTDEKFEKLLKNALTPQISDDEIIIKSKVRITNMKLRLTAAAACIALMISAIGIGSNYFKPADNTGFIIKANAAEIKKGSSVLIDNADNVHSLSGNAETGKVAFCIKTNFKCEGSGIETITYSINKGGFEISEKPKKSIIIDRVSCKPLNHCPSIPIDGGQYDFVSEYTVSYDKQSNHSTNISICGVVYDKDIRNKIWPNAGEKIDEKAVAEAYDKLIGDIEITCTAVFADGTSESKVISCGGKVVKYDNDGKNLNGERAAFVFELK